MTYVTTRKYLFLFAYKGSGSINRLISRYIFPILLFLISQTVNAQREANIWYFGQYAGLDFNSGTRVPLTDGRLNTIEGVATISNSNGNLLFYTDGLNVWNRVHQVMPNGRNLLGNVSSSQSAIIVPKIGDTTKYYVFTVSASLNYSVVNMTMDNGKGDIEIKNIPLVSNTTEKVTAVRHCNNRDVWVLTHTSDSDTYYAYLVDASGVSTTPVISHTGSVLWGSRIPNTFDSTNLGCLKVSPNGKKIAAAHWSQNFDVSDFNNATGVVSNSYSLFQSTDLFYLTYGVEFSPDGKLLYTTGYCGDWLATNRGNTLLQYDVSLLSPAAVRTSKQVINNMGNLSLDYGSLQLAPDGKMYMAKCNQLEIAAVNNPNVYGPACGFVTNAVRFTGTNQLSKYGLPTFIQSYFYPPDSFNYNAICPGNSFAFNYIPQEGINAVTWNFGDPASGTNNTSTLFNPTHRFSAPGVYQVQLIRFTNCGSDTIRKTIQADTLTLQLEQDTLVCGATNMLLNAAAAGSPNSYLWQDSSTNPTFMATTAGLYWVEVKNNAGCSRRDSIRIDFKPSPVFNLGADTAICENELFVMNAGAANADRYLWNTGTNTATMPASASGLYWCEANTGGCIFRDSLNVTIKPMPVVNLGNDTRVCEGIALPLDATNLNALYLWQDGSNNPTYQAAQPGKYFVQVNLNGCKVSDTISVSHDLKPKFTLGPDQLLCPAASILLNPSLDPSWGLLWQNGSTMPGFTVTQTGIYKLTVTNNCGSASDDVIIKEGICDLWFPSAFTPNRDGKNDLFKALGTVALSDYRLTIFNRWGAKIFETKDYLKGWDGNINGQTQETGAFIWHCVFKKTNDTETKVLKGTVLLIR